MAKVEFADKTQTAPYDAAKLNADDVNELKNSINAAYDAIDDIPAGADGADGADGPPGPQGEPGEGVAPGGAAGQILSKTDVPDFHTEWIDPPTGLPGGGTSSQVLAKVSDADGDVAWVDQTGGGGVAAPDGILSGLALSVTGLDLVVALGSWRIAGTVYSTTADTDIALATADLVQNRIDLIYADNTGAIAAVTGEASDNPTQPDLPNDAIDVGFVLVTPTEVLLTSADLAGYVTKSVFNRVIGSRPNLFTVSKNNIVSAINEVDMIANAGRFNSLYPFDIPDLANHFDFSDLSKIAVTPSLEVISITDKIGGIVSSQSNNALRPILNIKDGCAVFDQLAATYGKYLTGPVLSASTDFTIIVRRRCTKTNQGGYGNQSVFYNGDYSGGSTGYGIVDCANGGGTHRAVGAYFAGVVSADAVDYFTPISKWDVSVLSHSAGSIKLYDTFGVSRALTSHVANPIAPAVGHYIGNNIDAFCGFNGEISDIIFYPRQLNDIEVKRIVAYLNAKKVVKYPANIIFGGDSKMAGGGFIIPWNTLFNLMPFNSVYGKDTAVAGRGTQSIIDNLYDEVAKNIIPNVPNVYCVLVGHNDIAGGSSAAVIFSKLTTLCNTVKSYSNNMKVVICTDFPATVDSGWPGVKAAYNQLIRDNGLTIADAICDLAIVPFSSADGTHPDEATCLLAGVPLAAAIKNLLI